MPFSFLADLGSGVARLGSAFGRGFKRLGELGEDDDQAGLYRTPDFNQDPRRRPRLIVGPRALEDAVADAEEAARDSLDLERRNLPLSRESLPMPTLTPAPSLAELRSPLPSLRPTPRVTPAAAPAAPLGAVPDLVPDLDLDRRNLPIPRLPGHAGGPTPYNPIDAAEYDFVMRHAKRDAQGALLSKAEGGGFKRDWKTIAQNVLLGASAAMAGARPGEDPLGRAIGGAVTGGVGSVVNPRAGYEFNFDVGRRPKMESDQARLRAERAAMVDEALRQLKLDELRATVDESRARTRKLGEPLARQPDVKIGVNRQTGRREYFDANDPAQRQLYDAYVEPRNAPRGQMRLGRNTRTGEIDYYDPADQAQAADFEPYQFPRESGSRQSRGGALKQISEIKKLKRAARNAWGDWGKENDPKKREDLRIAASAAQAAYNDEVATLGEAFPDLYETGGFTEADGNQGWAYYKPREGGGQASPQRSSQPTGKRKAVVGLDFVQHVVDTLKVSPERARQMIEADGYTIKTIK
jgi:hypothetical protein